MAESTKAERTTLDAATILAGEGVFTPDAASVAARVIWIGEVMESTGSTATQVAGDVDAYYELKGTKNPRGYGRASLVNSATTGKLWEGTGLGKAQGTYAPVGTGDEKRVKGTHIQLIDRLDSARNAHGAKTVKALITATLESLKTDVSKSVAYSAVMDALGALIESPVQSESKAPKALTIADVINLLTKAHDVAYDLGFSELATGAIRDALDVVSREGQPGE